MSRRQRNTSRRQRNARIDELADEFDIEILRMEPADVYDPAVIGFAHDPSDAVTRLVYDCDRVIAQAVAFEGMSYELIQAHIGQNPVLPKSVQPRISAGLQRVILTAMAKEPADRYQTAHGLTDALHALATEYMSQSSPAAAESAPR